MHTKNKPLNDVLEVMNISMWTEKHWMVLGAIIILDFLFLGSWAASLVDGALWLALLGAAVIFWWIIMGRVLKGEKKVLDFAPFQL